ncbi:NAD+ synthase [Candidatus Woesearchaeota archaeon]|nr:NAD+ synthase [Candidatus Woesearchaeota archaeon]
MNTKEIYNALILGIRDYFKKNDFQKAVIGLSGGIDSSVACYLVVRALGSRNVTALLMPDLGTTSRQSIEDAKLIINKLRIHHHIIAINNAVDYFNAINKQLKFQKNIYAIANVKARARMTLLYYFANLNNALVIGTSDKSEIALGYTTKYGDNAADILVIGDLWKTEVIEMGTYLKVPKSILKKKPSAELIIGQTAEKELGASYEILDKILKMYIEEELSPEEIINKGFNKKIVKNIVERIRLNEHKRRTAMLIRVSERSFHGMEWRMPITNKFRG